MSVNKYVLVYFPSATSNIPDSEILRISISYWTLLGVTNSGSSGFFNCLNLLPNMGFFVSFFDFFLFFHYHSLIDYSFFFLYTKKVQFLCYIHLIDTTLFLCIYLVVIFTFLCLYQGLSLPFPAPLTFLPLSILSLIFCTFSSGILDTFTIKEIFVFSNSIFYTSSSLPSSIPSLSILFAP